MFDSYTNDPKPAFTPSDSEPLDLFDILKVVFSIGVLVMIAVILLDVGLPEGGIGPRGYGAIAAIAVGIPGFLRALRG